MRGRREVAAGVAVLAALTSCARHRDVVPTAAAASSPDLDGAKVVTEPPPEDGAWPLAGKDAANTRYSGLTEITTGNVGKLELAWSCSTGTEKGNEAAPLVVGDTLYVVLPRFTHKGGRLHVFRLP